MELDHRVTPTPGSFYLVESNFAIYKIINNCANSFHCSKGILLYLVSCVKNIGRVNYAYGYFTLPMMLIVFGTSRSYMTVLFIVVILEVIHLKIGHVN